MIEGSVLDLDEDLAPYNRRSSFMAQIEADREQWLNNSAASRLR